MSSSRLTIRSLVSSHKARAFCQLIALTIGLSIPAANAQEVADVRAAMQAATDEYFGNIAVQGGYVYFYSPDLSRRLGEGAAAPTEIWVQPPGTPTVGLAYVEAWHATQDRRYLAAATAAAEALIYGQLQSGGWTGSIDFNPQGNTAAYRNGRGRGRNFSTLDDGTTQAALQLLMKVDQAHEFNHVSVRQAVKMGLDALLAAQFKNGGFPQGWDDDGVQTDKPVVAANYPDYDWRTEGRIKEYWDLYTLNDGAAGTVSQTLLVAHDVYGAERFRTALRRLGDFLLLAQMPEPQPGWAQQYNYQMQPVWARRFEPAAMASRESQNVISALMDIYQATGDEKYLRPIPAALAWLRRSQLPDGQLPRYLELKSNRPLYMQRTGKQYSLTYDDSRLPGHYGWKIESAVDELQQRYSRLQSERNDGSSSPTPSAEEVRQILQALNDDGRWVSVYQGERLIGQAKFRPGDRYLASEVFADNLSTLARWLITQDHNEGR